MAAVRAFEVIHGRQQGATRPRSAEEALAEVRRQRARELAAREGFAELCAPFLLPPDEPRRAAFDRLVACVVADLLPVHPTALRVLVDVVGTRWAVERLVTVQRSVFEVGQVRAGALGVDQRLVDAMALDEQVEQARTAADRAMKRYRAANRLS